MYISSVAGTPELVVLAGEIPFRSEVTERTEPLPIAVSQAGPRGSDIMLMELARKVLEHGKKPTKLAVGPSIYGSVQG